MRTNKKKYLGWENYETWNVMLWINNTEELYFSVIFILENSSNIPNYKEVIYSLGLDECITGDGIPFVNNKLNYKELDIAIQDMRNSK